MALVDLCYRMFAVIGLDLVFTVGSVSSLVHPCSRFIVMAVTIAPGRLVSPRTILPVWLSLHRTPKAPSFSAE